MLISSSHGVQGGDTPRSGCHSITGYRHYNKGQRALGSLGALVGALGALVPTNQCMFFGMEEIEVTRNLPIESQ